MNESTVAAIYFFFFTVVFTVVIDVLPWINGLIRGSIRFTTFLNSLVVAARTEAARKNTSCVKHNQHKIITKTVYAKVFNGAAFVSFLWDALFTAACFG